MPIDYSKFDHIDSSDDEAPVSKKPAVVAQPPVQNGSQKLPEEHCRPLENVPELEMPEGEWLQYYGEKMTAPQRMQTLVHLWNSADQTERVDFLRHLIDIIGNPAVTNRIKGGQEVLKDLDANYYHGVTYPEKWVDSFQAMTEDKKIVFEKLFKTLDSQERSLVLGTLM
ncbi:unnamed protein product [Polarella glacialis]|uniref:Uncharacterized protein n=1 Tax=Polarella glacialis TaxID=89957 RepID=A0A813L982_POLGL|nr:unnamed protein product [Polarella glacialis]